MEKVYRLCRKNRVAAAVVELAIVLPLFLLLVLGMIEFGRMIMVQQIITNASREGARRAVLDKATAQEITNLLQQYLSNSGIQGATVTVSPNPPSSAGYGEPVRVTVSVPFNQVSWLPAPIFLGGRVLTSTTAMRRETVQ
ncbi:MAG: pilus assembly protein [Thermoguttaceae bacterium]|nr:pilus assembly protein [Thermoguttaceae bacterium]MDW8036797.1 TadE/TadG family type IV pilus assembly protein [Thermoguttaceae bacterium]